MDHAATSITVIVEVPPDMSTPFFCHWYEIGSSPEAAINKNTSVEQLLSFYMGKNTPDRQNFIIDKLRVEKDLLEEELV